MLNVISKLKRFQNVISKRRGLYVKQERILASASRSLYTLQL